MANQANNKTKKGSNALLIGVLILFLIGGGFGVYLITRKKDDTIDTKKEDDSVGGRKDYSDSLDDDEVIDPTITPPTDSSVFDPPPPPNNEIYLFGSQAQQLILEMAKEVVKSPEAVGKIKASDSAIGNVFTDNNLFNQEAQEAIDDMFSLFKHTVAGNPNTYPIYSTLEPNGKAIRDDLQKLVDTNWMNLGLSPLRAGGEPWYIGSLDLNMFYGKRDTHTHTHGQIWNYGADREGLDFYKKLNAFNVDDKRLVETTQGRESFAAGTTHKVARLWLQEIDRLDEEIKKEAQLRLEDKGWVFSLTQDGGSGTSNIKGDKMNS